MTEAEAVKFTPADLDALLAPLGRRGLQRTQA
jgi:hypothetical protein